MDLTQKLETENKAKKLVRSILTTNSVRLQTVYLGTRKNRITLHGVPLDISEEHLGAFFGQYRQVAKVTPAKGRMGISTEDVIIQVTLTRKKKLMTFLIS